MSTVNERYLKIKNHDGYKRDSVSGAIIADNRDQYKQFLEKKREKQSFKNRLDRVEHTLDKILAKLEEHK